LAALKKKSVSGNFGASKPPLQLLLDSKSPHSFTLDCH